MSAIAWHPHPDVWLVVAGLAIGYGWAVRRVGPSKVHPIERVVTRRQVAAFAAGLLSMWLVVDWPVHEIAEHHLYSAHMVQHLVLSLVSPPLLLIGTPPWMKRWLLGTGWTLRAVRFLTRPFVALVAFNAAIAVIHIPAVVTLMSTSEPAHLGFHVLVFGTALLMWSPVIGGLLELPSLSYPGRMFYLFLQSLVPTVPASFLTFGSTVLYHVYDRPLLFGISPLTDQRSAGLLMKIGGGFLLWVVAGWYFFKWFALEEREGVDVMEFRQVERDLDRAEIGSP